MFGLKTMSAERGPCHGGSSLGGPSPNKRAALEKLVATACAQAVSDSDRDDLVLCVGLFVEATYPCRQAALVSEAITEMVGNAIEHGFYGRSQGAVDIKLACGPTETRIEVIDNGWGFAADLANVLSGHGFRRLRSLGELTVASSRNAPGSRTTTVQLVLP